MFFDWGINVILWLQMASPFLDPVFIALTFLGNEAFFIVLIPLVYWCFDRRAGVGLALVFLLSVYFNEAAKVLAAQPRPFAYDSRVMQIVPAGGGGFPSGHTQQAVVVWGYLAFRLQKKWAWILAATLMALIPLSRVYLGVHFPIDLAGGYFIGALWLILFIRFEPTMEKLLIGQHLMRQLCWAFIFPILLIIIFPNCTSNGLTAVGTLMGIGIGFVLERRLVAFSTDGNWRECMLRIIIGVTFVAILRFGLAKAFSGLDVPALSRFVRYALVGFWAGFGAPWVFGRLNIASADKLRR